MSKSVPDNLAVQLNGLAWMEALRHIKTWNYLADTNPPLRRFGDLEEEARFMWHMYTDELEKIPLTIPQYLPQSEHLLSLKDTEYSPKDWVDFLIEVFESVRKNAGQDYEWLKRVYGRYFDGDFDEVIDQLSELVIGQVNQ